jgi:hypothetical protein
VHILIHVCSFLFFSCLVCDVSVSLDLLVPVCLHSLAPHGTNLTITPSPSINHPIDTIPPSLITSQVPSDLVLISNGNVRTHEDVAANKEFTGAQGVMSAEGLLDNPAIFAPPAQQPKKTALCLEYLDLAEKYPVKLKSLIFHCRRICRDEFNDFQLMEECVNSKTVADMRTVVFTAQRYVFCYTIVLPTSFRVLSVCVSISLSLVRLLLPACIL